jgi:hypothetical protein
MRQHAAVNVGSPADLAFGRRARVVENGKEPVPGAAEWRKTLLGLADAALESLRTGKAVKL